MTIAVPKTQNAGLSAKQAVRKRLRAASQVLLAAAGDTLAPETLHDLRIACRRAEAALCLSRDVVRWHSCRWLWERLSGLRHACNQARDDDVLLLWLKEQPDRDSTRSLR